MNYRAVLACWVVLAVRTSSAQTEVIGIVLDASGAPMTHALVEALPRIAHEGKGIVGDRPNPWTPVDEDGRFTITLSPGTYKIRAKDEAEGYPDPVYWLNADASAVFPEIKVGQEEVQGVRVILGKRGGVLSGELTDKESGNPVGGGKITLRDPHNHEAFIEIFADKSGRFEFTVPSKPIIISASVSDYKTTSFAEGAEVTLAAGEHREIVIELQHK